MARRLSMSTDIEMAIGNAVQNAWKNARQVDFLLPGSLSDHCCVSPLNSRSVLVTFAGPDFPSATSTPTRSPPPSPSKAKSAGAFNFAFSNKPATPSPRANAALVNTIGDLNSKLLILEEALHQAKFEAERAYQTEAIFLESISHELRTPMNTLVGSTDLLASSHLDDYQAEILQTIRHSSREMLALLNDLVDAAQIQAGILSLQKRRFDLFEVVYGAADLAHAKCLQKHVEFAVLLESDNIPQFVFGDELRVKQIIMQLLSNAVKFTDSGNVRLLLGYDEKVGSYRFTFEDTGIGISEQDMETLFRHFKSRTISNPRYGGMGLGLSICKGLVNIMQGSIHVSSQLTKGSKFTVEIPLEKSDAPKTVSVISKCTTPDVAKLLTIGLSELQKDSLSRLFRAYGVNFEELKTCTGEELSGLIKEADVRDGRRSESLEHIVLFTPRDFFLDNAQSFLIETAAQLNVAVICQGGVSFTNITPPKLSLKLHKLTMPIRPNQLRKMLGSVGLFKSLTPHGRSSSFSQAGTSSASHSEAEDDDFESCTTLNVLVVEDHLVNARIAKKMLEKLGCIVAIAEDGSKALEYVRTHPDDVHMIFMDCRMPVMDGYECARRIRELEKTQGWMRRLRILALSAHSYELHAEKCQSSGMDSVLVKPVTLQMLTEAVETYRTEFSENLGQLNC